MLKLKENQELTFRTIAMPADTNPAGDIFGGWVMSQMDLAAFVRACELSQGRTVTAAVKEMSFQKPVKVGDTFYVYTRPIKIGRSSITLEVEAWRGASAATIEKVTEAIFIMVAVDDLGQTRSAQPPLAAE